MEPLPVGKSIIICDDSPDTLSFMEFYLKSKGYSVNVASDFAELLAHLAAGQFDLLIQDIWMPGKDGFDVLKELQNRKISIPILFATGLDSKMYPDYPSIPKIREYIAKPFNNQTLLDRVEGMLGAQNPQP